MAAIDILYAQNPSNGGPGTAWAANQSKLTDFVNGGGVLIVHDRFVSGMAAYLPGSPGTFVQIYTSSIDVLDDTTSVTQGPAGVITDASLDGGNFSAHGYVVAGSVPPGSVGIIIFGSNPDQLVTYAYPYGSGWVIYSTIPLDFYLNKTGQPASNLRFIYAPNVVFFANELRLGVAP
ncbi:MAG: hypothetical protein IH942_08270 [Acidobacteria bacterium]|nr:hypothetical protein [Acidobacteriota bacterium]